MFSRRLQAVNGFKSDERGAVAVIFGLMTTALFLLAGVAVDFGRIIDMRERIAGAVDSASLAAGRALLEGKLTDGEIADLAKTFFDQNVAPAKAMGAIDEPVIDVDRANSTINIDVTAKVAMTLTRIGGFKEMSVPVKSQTVFQQRDIEVGMALDVTGSMDGYVGGQRKIDALKGAFETFAERLIPEQSNGLQKVRIGVAPYSSGVNLGDFAGTASGGKSKDGCVTERKTSSASDDIDSFYVKADGSKDTDGTEGQQSYTCPTNVLIPLSDDKGMLIQKVNAFTASGSTAGHMGAQWSWNLISDKWGGVWGSSGAPDNYQLVQDGKLIKAVVFMTDGIFNTAFHGSKSSQQAISLCDAMKAKGVVVFSVGFGLGGNQTAIDTLKTCATTGDGYFANASSPEELNAAFSRFAGKLTELRLSK